MVPPHAAPGADEVEEEVDTTRSSARSTFNRLPPLAAAAHATLVLQSSSLDPEAAPFLASPSGSEGRLHFADSDRS